MKLFLLLALNLFLHSTSHAQDKAAQVAEAPAKVLRHVVMFKFKDGTTKEQITAIEKAFADLPNKIDAIKGFEWGTNVSKENKTQGYTHCFVVTFADEAGLNIYTPHEAHQDFVKQILPILDKVLVFDYVS